MNLETRQRLKRIGQRGLKTTWALGRAALLNEQTRREAELHENALLVGNRVVPVPFETDRWWMRSETNIEDVYLIERQGDEWHCTCDGHLLGGHECKHIAAVKVFCKG